MNDPAEVNKFRADAIREEKRCGNPRLYVDRGVRGRKPQVGLQRGLAREHEWILGGEAPARELPI